MRFFTGSLIILQECSAAILWALTSLLQNKILDFPPVISQKIALACLLVLAISMPLSNAACFFEPLKPVKSDSEITGCRDSKGKKHLIGSRWMMDSCLRCSCLKDGIECCNNHPRPTNYDREKCISIFNKVTCAYKVVEKDDHSKVCPVHAWVI